MGVLHLVRIQGEPYVVMNEVADEIGISRVSLRKYTNDYIAKYGGPNICRVIPFAVGTEKPLQRSFLSVKHIGPIFQESNTRVKPESVNKIISRILQLAMKDMPEVTITDPHQVGRFSVSRDNEEGAVPSLEKHNELVKQLETRAVDAESRLTEVERLLIDAKESLSVVVTQKEGIESVNLLQKETISKLELLLRSKDTEVIKMQGWLDELIMQRDVLRKLDGWVDHFRFPPYPGLRLLILKDIRYYKNAIIKKLKTLEDQIRPMFMMKKDLESHETKREN